MKLLLGIIAFCLLAMNCCAVGSVSTNDSPAAIKERLYKRFLKEMREEMVKVDPSQADMFTNAESEASFREVFESVIVDPSFGLKWDEVPAPTLGGSNAMSAVNAFVATNGWNMQTNDCIFDCVSESESEAKSKPIRGLPWTVIHEREFPAVTHDRILYVFFGGFHHDGHGVAYNPATNHFSAAIDSFKPIGQHWYAWAFDHEFPPSEPQPKIYEGGKPVKHELPVSK